MRIQNSGNSDRLIGFDRWLQQLGNGNLKPHQQTDYITLPGKICKEIVEGEEASGQLDAIRFAFGIIETQCSYPDWPEYASKRAILAPTNNMVNQIKRVYNSFLVTQ